MLKVIYSDYWYGSMMLLASCFTGTESNFAEDVAVITKQANAHILNPHTQGPINVGR